MFENTIRIPKLFVPFSVNIISNLKIYTLFVLTIRSQFHRLVSWSMCIGKSYACIHAYRSSILCVSNKTQAFRWYKNVWCICFACCCVIFHRTVFPNLLSLTGHFLSCYSLSSHCFLKCENRCLYLPNKCDVWLDIPSFRAYWALRVGFFYRMIYWLFIECPQENQR